MFGFGKKAKAAKEARQIKIADGLREELRDVSRRIGTIYGDPQGMSWPETQWFAASAVITFVLLLEGGTDAYKLATADRIADEIIALVAEVEHRPASEFTEIFKARFDVYLAMLGDVFSDKDVDHSIGPLMAVIDTHLVNGGREDSRQERGVQMELMLNWAAAGVIELHAR